MHLELLVDELRSLIGEPGCRPAGWTDAEIQHVLLVAQCADAAETPSDLHALRVLRLRRCADEPPNTAAVQLSAARSLTITFKTDVTPVTAAFDVLSSRTDEPQ